MFAEYRLSRTPCATESHQNLGGVNVDYWETCVSLLVYKWVPPNLMLGGGGNPAMN